MTSTTEPEYRLVTAADGPQWPTIVDSQNQSILAIDDRVVAGSRVRTPVFRDTATAQRILDFLNASEPAASNDPYLARQYEQRHPRNVMHGGTVTIGDVPGLEIADCEIIG